MSLSSISHDLWIVIFEYIDSNNYRQRTFSSLIATCSSVRENLLQVDTGSKALVDSIRFRLVYRNRSSEQKKPALLSRIRQLVQPSSGNSSTRLDSSLHSSIRHLVISQDLPKVDSQITIDAGRLSQRFPHLRSLHLEGTQIVPVLTPKQTLPIFVHLQELHLVNMTISKADIPSVCKFLSHLPPPRRLVCTNVSCGAQGQNILNSLKFDNLEALVIRNFVCGDIPLLLRILAAANSLRLKELDFADKLETKLGLQLLTQILSNNRATLEVLRLDIAASKVVAAILGKLPILTCLYELNLTLPSKGINPYSVEKNLPASALSALNNLQHIRKLFVSTWMLERDQLIALMSAAGTLSQLEELGLRSDNIEFPISAVIQQLSLAITQLQKSNTLQKLRVEIAWINTGWGGNPVPDELFESLAEGLNSINSLRCVELNLPNVNYDKLVGIDRLSNIVLCSTQSESALDRLSAHSNLEHVSIVGIGLGDQKAMNCLASLCNHNSIRSLRLENCTISTEKEKQLLDIICSEGTRLRRLELTGNLLPAQNDSSSEVNTKAFLETIIRRCKSLKSMQFDVQHLPSARELGDAIRGNPGCLEDLDLRIRSLEPVDSYCHLIDACALLKRIVLRFSRNKLDTGAMLALQQRAWQKASLTEIHIIEC